MPSRFVILQHTIGDSQHWDLMLEQNSVLVTWRLDRPPTVGDDRPIPATKIPDHRIAYLDYEGPVSGDRGFVRRVTSGEVKVISMSDQYWELEFTGGSLEGQFVLIHRQADTWEFHRQSPACEERRSQ